MSNQQLIIISIMLEFFFGSCFQQNEEKEDEFIEISNSHPLFQNKQLASLILGNKAIKQQKTQLNSMNIRNSPFITIILQDNTIYQGKVANKTADDESGLLIFPDGSYYRGCIKNGNICGQGEYRFGESSYLYKGSWQKGLPSGFGVQVSPLGTYQGHFTNGNKQGRGKMMYNDGSCFIGYFANNQIKGQGTFTASKYIAKGNWLNGFLEGMGSQKYVDQSEYIGLFKKGKPHGAGKFIFPNNKVYTGTFQSGKPVGKGHFFFKNKQYEKDWEVQDNHSLSLTIEQTISVSLQSLQSLGSGLIHQPSSILPRRLYNYDILEEKQQQNRTQ